MREFFINKPLSKDKKCHCKARLELQRLGKNYKCYKEKKKWFKEYEIRQRPITNTIQRSPLNWDFTNWKKFRLQIWWLGYSTLNIQTYSATCLSEHYEGAWASWFRCSQKCILSVLSQLWCSVQSDQQTQRSYFLDYTRKSAN